MKRIKKIASVLLAVVMVLGMTMTAFAGAPEVDPSSAPDTVQQPAKQPLTIKKQSYSIYQIFTGEYYNGVLSNIKWGEDAKLPTDAKVGDPVSSTILEELAGLHSDADNQGNNYGENDVAQLAIINKYADTSAANTPMSTSEIPEFTGLKPGYYLVSGTVTYSDDVSTASTLYVVRVVDGTLSFQPKVGVPEVDKVIKEGDDEVKTNEASIGDTVTYEITGKLPTNFDVYNTYFYRFNDTLSKGLKLAHKHTDACQQDSNGRYICGYGLKVTIDGKDYTDKFYINATDYNATDGTTITVSIQDLKRLNIVSSTMDDEGNDVPVYAEPLNVTAASEIVITYDAILNENAVIAGAGNPNDVYLDYSNNPNDSGNGGTTPPPDNPDEPTPEHPTGETPKSEVKTYTTELTILKTIQTVDGKPLPGAEFTLTGDGVNIVKVTVGEQFVQDDDGTWYKLKDGTYTETDPIIADDETDNSADYDSTTTKYKKVPTTSVLTGDLATGDTPVVGVSGEDGKVTFTGLGIGKYKIEETKTPAGYNTADPIEFEITFDSDTATFASNNEKVVVGTDNMLDVTVPNLKGSLLPSTGGIGTTIFYVVGGILVIGAGVLLVAKKRMGRR